MFKIGQNVTPRSRALAAGRMISRELGLNKCTSLEELTAIIGKDAKYSTWNKLSDVVYGEKLKAKYIAEGTFTYLDMVRCLKKTLKSGRYKKPNWMK